MRAARIIAALSAAALITLGCAGCRDNLTDSVSGDNGSVQVGGELNGIQSTLDGIESDMAGDGSP